MSVVSVNTQYIYKLVYMSKTFSHLFLKYLTNVSVAGTYQNMKLLRKY